MSYILDALRKADAQRARDSARGIGAQGGRSLPEASASVRLRPWYLGGAAIAVVGIAWAGWAYYSARPEVQAAKAEKAEKAERIEEVIAVAPIINAGPARERQPGEVVQPPMMAPMAAPVVGGAVQPAPPDSAPQAMQPYTGSPRSARGRQSSSEESIPLSPATTQQPPPGMESPPMPTTPPAVATAIGPAPLQPPVAANAPAAPPAAGLPADAPKLSISGGVYSANRAQRMLIVNGQVFSEGSEITSGVVLDEVKPKVAVLRFKGSRYTVTY